VTFRLLVIMGATCQSQRSGGPVECVCCRSRLDPSQAPADVISVREPPPPPPIISAPPVVSQSLDIQEPQATSQDVSAKAIEHAQGALLARGGSTTFLTATSTAEDVSMKAITSILTRDTSDGFLRSTTVTEEQSHDASYLMQESASTVEALSSHRHSSGRSVSMMPKFFPTVCLPMEDFQTLTTMRTQEDIMHKLICPFEEMLMHFISHEWLGYQHPDKSGAQLSRMQQIFKSFLAGQAKQLFNGKDFTAFLKGVSTATMRKMHAVEAEILARGELQEEDLPSQMAGSCIWLDYHSIPQDPHKEKAIFQSAVRSIPHYVQRSDYFWICAPDAQHSELKEARDYTSWRGRGWCRIEEMANVFSTRLKMPLIVSGAPKLGTYGFFDKMMSFWGRPDLSVANGRFTCCALNHQVVGKDGERRRIPCDRESLEPVMLRMYGDFYHQLVDEKTNGLKKGLLRASSHYVFSGFELSESTLLPTRESLDDWLVRAGYAGLDDLDGMGYPPLIWACIYGSVDVVKAIAQRRPEMVPLQFGHTGTTILMRSIHRPPQEFCQILKLHPTLTTAGYIDIISPGGGFTAVDRAAKAGFHENMKRLLELRADTEPHRKDNGATPLISAAEEGWSASCQVLLHFRADVHAVDSSGKTALHHAVAPTVLGNAARDAKAKIVDMLLQARASLNAADNDGRLALHIAQETNSDCLYKLDRALSRAGDIAKPAGRSKTKLNIRFT